MFFCGLRTQLKQNRGISREFNTTVCVFQAIEPNVLEDEGHPKLLGEQL